MTYYDQTQSRGLVLTGLDGSNPLAFLAALGALRTLSLAWPEKGVKMRWVQHAGAWRPEMVLRDSGSPSSEDCLLALESQLAIELEDHPLSRFSTDSTADCSPHDIASYWISALRSDLAPEATSQLQTVRRDYFLGNIKAILHATTRLHLRQTLFELWAYNDALDNQSLHFDPTEDRRHAYQWNKPSGDPARKVGGGMLGANRLAIEAFPFFQAFASGDKLMTRGFLGLRANDTRWTWPIWAGPIDSEVVNSLLALTSLQDEAPAAHELIAIGVRTAFRCRRIVYGKTPNFSPATAVF
jgi:CRISPR-associated endonuclease/helicase Cas3